MPDTISISQEVRAGNLVEHEIEFLVELEDAFAGCIFMVCFGVHLSVFHDVGVRGSRNFKKHLL